ncbi:hypothetical protein HU200_024279 [Digitaria exilis]|uniref:Uncharacterized protein n=1 Tax=Digitaria exilis TaxID=1010633 RepID=A0A835C2E6_9POAL|nr:hypothetical protein HU200_024279 [Digitaria exilis]
MKLDGGGQLMVNTMQNQPMLLSCTAPIARSMPRRYGLQKLKASTNSSHGYLYSKKS